MAGTLRKIGLKNGDLDTENAKLGHPPTVLSPLDATKAQDSLNEWVKEIDGEPASILQAELKGDDQLSHFLAAAFQLSPYLNDLARRFPGVVADCIDPGFQTALDRCLSPVEALDFCQSAEAELSSKLRAAKQQAALVCGLADLGGWWSWEKISRSISRTADSAVCAVVDHLLLQSHLGGKLNLPDPDRPSHDSGYIVLAMGKHGAGELNFSSDIDLIVLFDPASPSIVDPDESVKLFVRLTRNLVRIMQERTADGYVFRTDLRLRPDPGSMPLAIPLPIA